MSEDYVPGTKSEPVVNVDYIPPGVSEQDILDKRAELKKQVMAGDGSFEAEGEKTAFMYAESLVRAGAGSSVNIGIPVSSAEMTAEVAYKDVYAEQAGEEKGGLQ